MDLKKYCATFEHYWKQFDKATAYGCNQRGLDYNPNLAKLLWDQYCQCYIDHGMIQPTLEFKDV